MTKTTNEMIFATLKTKAEKPAKYAEQLRELGYEVENTRLSADGVNRYERNYWAVNGLEVNKYEGVTAQLSLGRGQYVEKFENIKRIDFVGYFAKLDERKAKAERVWAHDGISDVRNYYVNTETKYVDENGHKWNWPRYRTTEVTRKVRTHRYTSCNYTINEYKELKRKAEAANWRGLRGAEIKYAEDNVARAEKRVEDLWKQLEEAEREVERRKAELQKEIDKKAEGQNELDAWLEAKGIIKNVA